MTPAADISVVIPVLNDAAALERCLRALAQCARDSLRVEIIVADGGSTDDPESIATHAGGRFISARRGRGAQLNAGARHATGRWLWFLHADCEPDVDSLRALAGLDESVQWGCFRHRIDAPGLTLRIVERADNLRARLFHLPYGDQGIFVRREAFTATGGFDDVPLLEDVMLARKLSNESAPRVLAPILRSDARRWLAKGVAATTLINWSIMLLYFCGRSPEKLARRYVVERTISV